MLGSRDVTAFAADGVWTVIARRTGGPVSLCCSIVAPLTRIADSDLWTLSLRLFDLDRAIVDVQILPQPPLNVPVYRGAKVPLLDVAAKLSGSLVNETLASAALGETRKLTIYLPPGFDAKRRYPALYMADGYALSAFAPAIEARIVSGQIRPLIVVGIWPGQGDPQDRAREYLPDRLPGRYRAHAQFVLDEVLPLAEAKYGASSDPQDRMLAGFSDGAAWALSLGLGRGGTFGQVAVLSFGWPAAADGIERAPRPRLFFAAGRLEPGFYKTTVLTARHAQATGGGVELEEYTSAHSLFAWTSMIVDALAWAFPAVR